MANIRTGRRSGLVLRGGRDRRDTLWGAGTPASSIETASGGTLLTSLGAGALALRPFTIIRNRFTFHISSDQAAAAEDQVGAYGRAVVSDQASAIGVTAVPTPITDQDSDLWHVYATFVQGGSRVNDGMVGRTYEIDSKAMRKVEDGQDVVSVVEFSAQGGGFRFIVTGRFLLKLH